MRTTVSTDSVLDAITAQFTPEQAEKARELLEDGGLVETGRNRYKAVSTDGSVVYTVTPWTCTCPAGRRACYHQMAARVTMALSR